MLHRDGEPIPFRNVVLLFSLSWSFPLLRWWRSPNWHREWRDPMTEEPKKVLSQNRREYTPWRVWEYTYVSICFLLVKTCPSLKSPRLLYMWGWRKYKSPSIMESLIANFLDILGLNFLPLIVSLLPQILGGSENNSVSLHVRTWLILHGTWYTVATLCRPATEWNRRLRFFLHVVCCDGHTWKGKCQHF